MAEENSLFSILMQLKDPKLKCVIKEIAKSQFKNDNTKFTADALIAFTAVIKVFIGEAAARATLEAKKDDAFDFTVTNEHLEKILPQLLFHF